MARNLNDMMASRSVESQNRISEMAEEMLLEVKLQSLREELEFTQSELAKNMGINSEIIEAAPTDGLWGDNRTDEDQIGATYDELEWAMTYEGKAEDLLGKQKEIYYIYQKFHKMNKHKMLPIPIFKV